LIEPSIAERRRLCNRADKGHLLPDFCSATGLPARFSEGFSLRRLHPRTAHRLAARITQKSAFLRGDSGDADSLTFVDAVLCWGLKMLLSRPMVRESGCSPNST
jgi:hypothetical protein